MNSLSNLNTSHNNVVPSVSGLANRGGGALRSSSLTADGPSLKHARRSALAPVATIAAMLSLAHASPSQAQTVTSVDDSTRARASLGEVVTKRNRDEASKIPSHAMRRPPHEFQQKSISNEGINAHDTSPSETVKRLGIDNKDWSKVGAGLILCGCAMYIYTIAKKISVPNKVAFGIVTASSWLTCLSSYFTKDASLGFSQLSLAAGGTLNFAATLIWGAKRALSKIEKVSAGLAAVALGSYAGAKMGIFNALASPQALNDIAMLSSSMAVTVAFLPLMATYFSQPKPESPIKVAFSKVMLATVPWAVYTLARACSALSIAEYSFPNSISTIVPAVANLICGIGTYMYVRRKP